MSNKNWRNYYDTNTFPRRDACSTPTANVLVNSVRISITNHGSS